MSKPFEITQSERLIAIKVACAGMSSSLDDEDISSMLFDQFRLRKIGSGAFSSVYSSDDLDSVVKVNMLLDAYPMFVKYCVDVQDDPVLSANLPTILYFRPMDEGYVCILPKYRATGMVMDFSELSYEQQCTYANISEACTGSYDNYGFFGCDVAKREGEGNMADRYYRINSGEYRDVYAAAEIMRDELSAYVGSFDLHGGNYMLDGERIVIIDPIAGLGVNSMPEYTSPALSGGAS